MKGGATFDTSGLDAIIKGGRGLAKLKGATIKVGVQKGATDEKGGLIAPYAAHNNFGTKNAMGGVLIPARPFMVYSAQGIQKWMRSREFIDAVSRMNAGKMTPEQILKLIGLRATEITEDKINNPAPNVYAPNKPSTLARKKGSKPLIDSESLVNSIRYIIVRA